jgi:hypothetical protein
MPTQNLFHLEQITQTNNERKRMSNNMNAVVNSKAAQSIVAKNYDPMISNLTTLEIKNKTVDNYYNQIKNNFYLGVKAHYIIARDLYDANQTLDKCDYQRLVGKCGFSGSTQRKYLAIGGDYRLFSLFTKGTLPMKWTNQYLLTQLTTEQFKKVESKVDAETSASKIKELADMKKEQVKKIENMLLTFLKIEIDKSQVNVAKFQSILDKVKKGLSNIPEITIVDDRVVDVEKRISNYTQKIIAKNKKEMKKKEVKQKKVA